MAFPLMAPAQGSSVVPPKNRYKVCDDVQLGRQTVTQVERQLPPLPENSEIDAYVERMGRRLVEAVPHEFQHQGFTYQFDVVNAREINAFALPGGPMYVNRGMIDAARSGIRENPRFQSLSHWPK
jgi:beta-barrel assembly-enhancing protease